ncbi:hypothetical protein MJO29_003555 [Puccinia striiformis f. sp. tritici]|nr:hypothetical protein Pst134EB_005663 [Puccinia striiformis f. sp. tritici]KAI7965457.1 hypothetical protein MJO29_003555 [Puccinia striiformis f. sp. tritici]
MYTQNARLNSLVLILACLFMGAISQPLTSSNTAKNFILEGRSHWPVDAALERRGSQSPTHEGKPPPKFKRPTVEVRSRFPLL